MKRTGLLNNIVSLQRQIHLFVKSRFLDEFHVGIYRKSIGSGGIPTETLAELLCVYKGERTIYTEILPGMLIGFGWDLVRYDSRP
jgi:hypothetical protein